MKGAFLFTAAAGLVGSAIADNMHNRHAHKGFHRRGQAPEPVPEPATTCGCTTKVITIYPTEEPEPMTTEKTTTLKSTSYTTVTVEVTESPVVEEPLPTNVVTVFPTPGTYTVDPTTIVVTKETTVCDATSTAVDPGEHTYGGVTTVVETATTIVCPIATVKPTGSTFTSVIETTTFVCPTGGTYTIGPSTTSVPKSTVIVYPTPAPITTGTYVNPGETLTVTETDFSYVCPKPTNPDEAPESSAPPPPPKTTAAPEPEPTKPAPPKETKPAPPKETKPAPPTEDKPEKPDVGGGDKWGMTYSPYNDDGQCRGAGDVSKDIAIIKKAGFKAIRLYSTDCDGLENVGKACKTHELKLILGVFISETGIEGAQDQVTDIVKWGQFGMVDLIVVGNEAIFSGHVDAGSLAGFIGSCKKTFQEAGYNGPVTTTEPTNIWQENGSALCGSIDVLGANLHCFFNTEVDASDCGKFVAGQMELLGDICDGMDVVNLETGWPNAGNSNGAAVPGESQQAKAISSLVDKVGGKSVFFSFTDDQWKDPGPLGVEQSWGCIKNF